MKCKECLFEFNKPKNGFLVYKIQPFKGEVWLLCPHCYEDIPTKQNRKVVKGHYERLNK